MSSRIENEHVSESSEAASILRAYLDSKQEILVDLSIEVAKSNGYAPFTTTIRGAWVEAIHSVSEGIGTYLASSADSPGGPEATHDYRADPRFRRMRQIARQHRSIGITHQMYLGLFKHFRNIYLDAIDEAPTELAALKSQVRDFFDGAELSVTADWTGSDDNQRLRELQERTRAAALEKDRYFAIFESLRNPAFLLDRENRLINANQAAAELFLGDAEAGNIIYLRSMRRERTKLQQIVDRVIEDEPGTSQWLDTLTGPRFFDVRKRALHDAVENIAIGHVLLLNDVTAHQRAVEKAQMAERQMSRFLATMSHEIRTPLHSVLGAADLLRTADRQSHANYLDVIESAGRSLLQTLNNVLDYAKFERSAPVPRPVMTSLPEALEAFGQVVSIGMEARTDVTIRLDPQVAKRVSIDWAMAQQVLLNLVSNAVRHDSGSGVVVGISAAAGDRLRFEVRDHGPGLPEHDAEALFRPFAETFARNTGGGGAGLGLAISHHLVAAMGGRIGHERPEVGALVWFEVPCQSENEEPSAITPDAKSGSAKGQGKTCLLVDDDSAGAVVTRSQLERLGLVVDVAIDVAAALEATRETRYDFVVADYLLPDGNGPAMVQAMRSTAGGPTRYIALTANVEAINETEENGLLFDRVLAKPADLSTLSEAILGNVRIDVPVRPATSSIGVSPEAMAAMVAAFETQWLDFRANLTAPPETVEQMAHRLAGSSAQLGLSELEASFRKLEACCANHDFHRDHAAAVKLLDRDLEEFQCWRELSAEAAQA